MGNPISGQAKDWAAGERIRALALNRIGDAAAQNQGIFPGAFDYGGRFPGGTVRIPNSAGSAAASTTIFPPWYPFLDQDMSGNYQANFFPGTAGGILTSNGYTAIALTQSQVNYLYLAMTAAGGVVTGATLTASTTYPAAAASTASSPPTAFNLAIAIADLTGTPAITNVVGFGNIWAQPFVAYFDTINTGLLLTAPFTPWYNWEWGASL